MFQHSWNIIWPYKCSIKSPQQCFASVPDHPIINQILTTMFQHKYLTLLMLNQILTTMFCISNWPPYNPQSNPHNNVLASVPDFTNAQSNPHNNVLTSEPDLSNTVILPLWLVPRLLEVSLHVFLHCLQNTRAAPCSGRNPIRLWEKVSLRV